MKIHAADAVSHITNSLENMDANIWHDGDADVTWVVRRTHDFDGFEFEFIDGEGNEFRQTFRLVAEPEVVAHELIPGGPKDETGQLNPRPSCACGASMPEGIKTSPQGWFYGHTNYGW